MVRLKNNSDGELTFPTLAFTAPAGEFDVLPELAKKLLTNDAIQKAELANEVETKVIKLKEKK